MDEISRRVGPSFRMLRVVSHSQMGLAEEITQITLLRLCQQSSQLCRCRLPAIHRDGNRKKLNILQNKVLRVITGQLVSTPVEAYYTHSKRLLAQT